MYREEKRMKKKFNKGIIKTNKKIFISVLVILVIAISGSAVYAAATSNKINSWNDKAYPGVKVDDVDVSGKTKDQVIQILKEDVVQNIGIKKINVEVKGIKYSLSYSELSPEYNIDETASAAVAVGKESSFFKKKAWIDGSNTQSIPLSFNYDTTKLESFKNEILSSVNKPAKNASIKIIGGNISIASEQDGEKLSVQELETKIKEGINGKVGQDTKIVMSVEVDKPTITKEALSKITGIMSSFQTSYATSSAARTANVELAAKYINSKLLMPGEVFSYNEAVGERTYARGFRDAPIFVGDKVESGLGGGICKVSTTLYRAAMAANLRSVERTNHSMPTSYAKPGLDATVVWGAIDYKFKNTYSFPIYIEAVTASRNVIINIYGDPAAMEGKTFQLVAETIETIQPVVNTVDDATLPQGQTQVEKSPVVGYKVRSYQVTYQNGAEISRETVATDIYKKVDGVVKRGTKQETPVQSAAAKAAQPTQPTQSTQPTQPTQSTQVTQPTQSTQVTQPAKATQPTQATQQTQTAQ